MLHEQLDNIKMEVVDNLDIANITPPSDLSGIRLLTQLDSPRSTKSWKRPHYRSARRIRSSNSKHVIIKDDSDVTNNSIICHSPSGIHNLSGNFPATSTPEVPSSSLFPPPKRDNPVTINPFTPNGKSKKKKVPRALSFHEEDDVLDTKRPKLNDFSTRRFDNEFIVQDIIASGEYGCVYKCLNKINGIIFAVKKKYIKDETATWNEVLAYSAVCHPYIIRNCSSWAENSSVYLQNEYCNRGNLEEFVTEEGGSLTNDSVIDLLEHISEALRYLHLQQLTHCSIRPKAILVSIGPALLYRRSTFQEKESTAKNDSSHSSSMNKDTLYKLGSLSRLRSLEEEDPISLDSVDRRFAAKELHSNKSPDLIKCDIFSLALTAYWSAGSGPLPEKGSKWHQLRNKSLPKLPQSSNELSNLLQAMAAPKPVDRLSTIEILEYIDKLRTLMEWRLQLDSIEANAKDK